ncbi:hypothetical protein F5Y00DRAFT_269734 [Daldinia vernicosa]|uniref:uncharacterized protein n=1 Tax=Daldinia vernicosa TaxID=114800 RepID=UPI002007D30E|nr:uncharacterized protein F5Y00DRAFT_269734 [Daldinia vernicosa]KAI0849108.1 hypothetical protein F5Y00DRAFT_269734 [Daldinia vernicosa]
MAAQGNGLICPICGHTSNSPGNASDHLRYIHVGLRCFFPGCNVRRTSEADLRQHIADQHGSVAAGANGYFRCPWPACAGDFAHRNSVKRCLFFHTHDQANNQPQAPQAVTVLNNQVAQQIIAQLTQVTAQLTQNSTQLNAIAARLDVLETNVASMREEVRDVAANNAAVNASKREREDEGDEEEAEEGGRASKRSRN